MTRGGPGPRCEIVTSADRFRDLAAAWATLWRPADGSVFQSHAWISAWHGTLPPDSGQRLNVALAWRDGVLVGAMPLAIRRHRGLRVLEWAAKACSDYCDVLVAPGEHRDALARQLWEAVRNAGGFDLAYLSHIAPEAAASSLAADGSGEAAPLCWGRRSETSLRVRTAGPPGGEAWFETLSKKARQNYRRGHKALAESGTATFRLLEPYEPLGPVLDRMVALKRDWLSRTGQSSALVADGAGILEALVGALARTGRLRVFVLECNGELVAGSVNFAEHGRLMAFFAAYDPAYERASPGMLIMVDYVKWAFDRGLGEIDFLCGAEEYKRRFCTAEVELRSAVAALTLAGHAALLADRAAEVIGAWRSRRSAPSAPGPHGRSAAEDGGGYPTRGPRRAGRSDPTETKPVMPASS